MSIVEEELLFEWNVLLLDLLEERTERVAIASVRAASNSREV